MMKPDLIERIRAIWAKVPDAHCKGLCAETCGPIQMSEAEQAYILEKHGFIPHAPVQEGDSDTDTVLIKSIMALNTSANDCCALKDGRCTIYEDRPLVCRLWGVIRNSRIIMKCPHGCAPDKWLIDRKAKDLLGKMDALTPRPTRSDGS